MIKAVSMLIAAAVMMMALTGCAGAGFAKVGGDRIGSGQVGVMVPVWKM